MKKILSIGFVSIPFILIMFWSCEPLVTYPLTPEVSFKSISMSKATDDLGNIVTRSILTIHVIDGDGDIGLNEDTSINVLENSNLFIRMLKKTQDGFIEGILYPYRTPYLAHEGQDKSLVADFEITNDFTIGALPLDTIIKFSFYIYDRQRHMSNIGETPEFPSDTLAIITGSM